ncbi:hypothetical protein PVK06_039455 [Gossypium arboreum]|uniref:Uncharacterized protein n=1 Tax=Gossypium arboreum TaxID=29729 RepID=A0ABR0N2Y4_GOSAR|nr:hypothetical protein PVK06_039455 [Gossypium arboreum]
MSLNPIRYDIFEVKGDIDVKVMIDRHCSNGNAILELYAHFFNVEESGLNSTIGPINLCQEQEAESPTTQSGDRFTALLQSSYQEMSELKMGRHSSISTFSYNRGFTRKDDVPLTTYIGERTSNTRHATRIDNEYEARNEKGERAKKEKGAENEKESKINDDLI